MKGQATTLKRSSSILFEKFLRYLFPAILTMAALSLSEFADSMIVANLLGEKALTIVQLGYPLVLVAATCYVLIGSGGSTLYSIALGEGNRKKAGAIFSISMLAALLLGIFIFIFEFSFFNPLANQICKNQELLSDFKKYLFVLLFSSPFLVTFLSFLFFLPPSGAPLLATIANIIANVINILMDYVYIHFFRMGVEGAAWATFTGYVAAIIFIIFALKIKKIDIRKKLPCKQDFILLKDIITTGSPYSISQLGFVIKFSFFNSLAVSLGGSHAIIAFSLFVQALSIVSIFLSADLQATSPFVAFLHGQKDYQGEKRILHISFITQFIFAALSTAYFTGFPSSFARLYDIQTGPALDLAVKALRITSIHFIIRGFYMVFLVYLQVLGRKAYALFISLFDGFIGNILVALLLCHFTGLDGIWWTFPITAILLLLLVLPVNLIIAGKSDGKLQGIFLTEKNPENPPLLDLTMIADDADLSDVSKKAYNIFIENGFSSKLALKASLIIEEIAVFTKRRLDKKGYIDLFTLLGQDRLEINFRCIGATGALDEKSEKDLDENLAILKGMADKIEYDFIMGMSCMRIIINRKEKL